MQGILNLRKRLERIENDLNTLFRLYAQVTSEAFVGAIHNAGIWVVDDVAALRNVASQAANRIAFVGMAATGERTYRWTTPMPEADNGVTHIRPADYSGDGWVLVL